jgi:hypothetical protein
MDDERARMHLIDKRSYFKKLNDREYESGWWAISEEAAARLIGGLIFFHEEKKKPSFFGGTVLGFRIETEGEHKDRVIIRLESSQECKGVKAGPERWALEKKSGRGPTAASAKKRAAPVATVAEDIAED